MNKVKRRLIRRIQYWLSKHEYMSGYGIKLYQCGIGSHNALCRTGVVDGWGGGAVIDSWHEFTTKQLRILFNRAKKLCQSRMCSQ